MAQRISHMSAEEQKSFRLDENLLGPVHWRSIERLYAEQGPVLCDLIRKNPVVAIPLVVVRLEQKDEEWRRVRAEMTRVWRKIYEQNYHKSLDHRSFYFKQAEKRCVARARDTPFAPPQPTAHVRMLALKVLAHPALPCNHTWRVIMAGLGVPVASAGCSRLQRRPQRRKAQQRASASVS